MLSSFYVPAKHLLLVLIDIRALVVIYTSAILRQFIPFLRSLRPILRHFAHLPLLRCRQRTPWRLAPLHAVLKGREDYACFAKQLL